MLYELDIFIASGSIKTLRGFMIVSRSSKIWPTIPRNSRKLRHFRPQASETVVGQLIVIF